MVFPVTVTFFFFTVAFEEKIIEKFSKDHYKNTPHKMKFL